MRILSKLRASLVLAGTVLVVGAGLSAGAAQAVDGYHEIRAEHSNKCVDVAWASQDHKANVIQGDCKGTPNQRWRKVDVGFGYFQLRAQHSEKCLDVAWASVAHGADIIQGTCVADYANQHWYTVNVGNGFFEVRARHSHKCMDVAWSSVEHKADILQATCVGTANQHWKSALFS